MAAARSTFRISNVIIQHVKCIQRIQARNYAKPKLTGKPAMVSQKVQLDVVTDPEKLVTHCCGANIYINGEDPPLRPDNEYPDWLWNMRLEREPIPLSELEPNSYGYWKRVLKMKIQEQNRKKRPYRLK